MNQVYTTADAKELLEQFEKAIREAENTVARYYALDRIDEDD